MDLKASPGKTDRGGFAGIVEQPPRKVLIAAIEGFAPAGGLEITLGLRSPGRPRDARLWIPKVGVGLIAAADGLLRLPRRIPCGIAMEMAVTGVPIDAERALGCGLVNRPAEPGEALGLALELAHTIAEKAPLAVAASKQMLVEMASWDSGEEWDSRREIAQPIHGSEDAPEGTLAFAEKRRPTWKGR